MNSHYNASFTDQKTEVIDSKIHRRLLAKLIIILGVNIMILPESLPLGSKYVRLTLCLLLFRSKLFGNRSPTHGLEIGDAQFLSLP